VHKIPRDISGKELVKILSRIGFKEVRRTSSHIRLSANISNKLTHHITIPDHNPIKIGTLNNIIRYCVKSQLTNSPKRHIILFFLILFFNLVHTLSYFDRRHVLPRATYA